MRYEIESGIPMPPPANAERQSKYPFRDMKVGDSFFVPRGKLNKTTLRSNYNFFAKMHPEFKFAMRTFPEGFRVWRVAKEVQP